jgi:hypothetical protein
MCSHISWFFSYQFIDETIVLMRNDISCKSVRIERSKIKMFHGIVSTLMDVRHVPKLKNNFISFGNFGFWSL